MGSPLPSADALAARAQVIRRIRAFFESRDFLEVETPVRIAAPAPEPHIDCPAVIGFPDAGHLAKPEYLRASPELQMKRLLAAGIPRIWQIGPCFREGERGRRHNPEFTMLEWYRANADYLDILADMEALVRDVLGTTGCGRSFVPDVDGFHRLTVRDAYRTFAGWDPFSVWDADRFDFDMATKIEPNLPKDATFLIDYPPQAASLSKLRGNVAERWELYVNGMELANAFTELTDPAEQRARFLASRAERAACGEADYPLDEDFLDCLSLMPRTGGVALGVDRLVMLATGADDICQIRMVQ